MKKHLDTIITTAILLISSLVLYLIHFLIFNDPHHIFIFSLSDIAFLPIEVLIVTLVIEKVLERREKRNVYRKLYMVIGTCFNEIGNSLLDIFINGDPNIKQLKKVCYINEGCSSKEFNNLITKTNDYKFEIEIISERLENLKDQLSTEHDFLLRLIGNPTLLEHEMFSELLMATLHLQDELSLRSDLNNLSPTDAEHISNDISRVYKLLFQSWVRYMEHLKDEYPYLFSLALRTNPFDDNCKVEVE